MIFSNYPQIPLKEAETAFFPILYNTKDKHIIPEQARKESFAGIAMLPPIFSHRILLNTTNGITHFQDKIPLCFAVFSADHDQSPECISKFWNNLREQKKKLGHATLWIIAPPSVCKHITEHFLTGSRRVYYHVPTNKNDNFLFAITVTHRIKTYRVEDPFQERMN